MANVVFDESFASFFVNISVEEAEKVVLKSNIGASFAIKGKNQIDFSENKKCVVMVVEKYFTRVDNYAAGTIIIDNALNKTRVQIIAAGGGKGIAGADWGSEDKFEGEIESAFIDYIID